MARKTGPIKISPGPTLAARMPSMAVRAYAGATEEIPSMVPPKRPTTIALQTLVCHLVDPSSSWNCEL
jgi:hypothetical protein